MPFTLNSVSLGKLAVFGIINNQAPFFISGGKHTTGNVVRKALNKPKFLARVFGIPLSFINRIRTLLLGIRSTNIDPLDPAKVKDFCDETIDQYYSLFPWAPMNPTLHMLLAHLPEILENVPEGMKLGYFSEEPLESSHKQIRQFAKTKASAKTRQLRLKNVFQRQLDICNPKVLKKLAKYHKKPQVRYPKELEDLQKTLDYDDDDDEDETMDTSQ